MGSHVFTLGLLLIVIHHFLSDADALYTKTDDAGVTSEVARQGRSGANRVELAARNDRFYMGSRYGKRMSNTRVASAEASPGSVASHSTDATRTGRSWGEPSRRSDTGFFLGSRYGKRAPAQDDAGTEEDSELWKEEVMEKTPKKMFPFSCVPSELVNLCECFTKLFAKDEKIPYI